MTLVSQRENAHVSSLSAEAGLSATVWTAGAQFWLKTMVTSSANSKKRN
jgi:hypothetical protein